MQKEYVMNIQLYTTISDSRQLNKDIGNGFDVRDVVYKNDNISITKPTLILNGTVSDFKSYNYVYIETLSRYYFITAMSSVLGGKTEMQLEVDVLMSFKDDIKMLDVVAKRSENHGDCYIRDEAVSSEMRTAVSTHRISNGLFYPHALSENSRCFVVTVLSAAVSEG